MIFHSSPLQITYIYTLQRLSNRNSTDRQAQYTVQLNALHHSCTSLYLQHPWCGVIEAHPLRSFTASSGRWSPSSCVSSAYRCGWTTTILCYSPMRSAQKAELVLGKELCGCTLHYTKPPNSTVLPCCRLSESSSKEEEWLSTESHLVRCIHQMHQVNMKND